ncbi:MAG: hypothetical protein CVV24_02625 [Ignavibacteriae bacterium HGW-Ignavibacteriae-3]|nr:MAG: hypothetical protein CVV24_02625 [Ignavibacteriae bacterium HGW-Ignavibacteriae-3]
MNPLEKFSKKFGFTATETNVVFFILFACVIAVTLNIIKDKKNEKAFLEFNYKIEDSLFNAASGDPGMADSTGNLQEKKIASQPELLDFTKEKFSGKISKINSSSLKKINLNKAGAAELNRLPGFGPKSVAAIIEYRSKKGGFKSINELLNIKGIGIKKLDKIRNLITLD